MIAEIGAELAPDGETVVDAGGAYVAPGFIDCHTHYDPSVWWDPLVDPMPQHGVTTVVTGNCSLSLTPVRAPDRVSASDVFGFIEDIPVDAFTTGIPWTWESYAEWRDALRAHGTAVNVAALVGHSNLRVYVMGDDAWTRAATPEERDAAGRGARRVARGRRARHVDVVRRPGPPRSRGAEPGRRRRRAAGADRGARRRAGRPRVLEFLPWIKEIDRQLVDIDRVARWCGARRRVVHVEPAGREQPRPSHAPSASSSRRTRSTPTAAACTAQVSPRPFDLHVSFDQTPAFVAIPAWGQLIALPTADEKRAMLADREWRAAARADWDRVGDGFTIFPVSRLDRVRLTSVRAGEERFLDATFADVVAARGGHPSDVLADWVLEHDLAPGHGGRGAVEQQRARR